MTRFAFKTIHIVWLCVILQFSLINICFAEDDPMADLKDSQMPDVSAGFGGNYYESLLWVIVVLAVIIGLIVIVIRFLAQKNRSWMGNRSIRLLGGVALGQNKSLQIVEIGRSIYLIGVGENVQLLEKVDHLEEINEIKGSFSSTGASDGSPVVPILAKLFTKFIIRGNSGKAVDMDRIPLDNSSADTSFQTIFQAKMESITTNRKRFVDEILQDDKSKERSNEQ